MKQTDLTDIQYQIIGCIFLGDYNTAAQLVRAHPEYIEFVMQATFRDGYRECLQSIHKLTTEDMNKHHNTRMLR